jgi:hypothetical protein
MINNFLILKLNLIMLKNNIKRNSLENKIIGFRKTSSSSEESDYYDNSINSLKNIKSLIKLVNGDKTIHLIGGNDNLSNNNLSNNNLSNDNNMEIEQFLQNIIDNDDIDLYMEYDIIEHIKERKLKTKLTFALDKNFNNILKKLDKNVKYNKIDRSCFLLKKSIIHMIDITQGNTHLMSFYETIYNLNNSINSNNSNNFYKYNNILNYLYNCNNINDILKLLKVEFYNNSHFKAVLANSYLSYKNEMIDYIINKVAIQISKTKEYKNLNIIKDIKNWINYLKNNDYINNSSKYINVIKFILNIFSSIINIYSILKIFTNHNEKNTYLVINNRYRKIIMMFLKDIQGYKIIDNFTTDNDNLEIL